ncbi:MAG: hypothetical protein H7346_09860 [Burkholderiaceae bacterium]|nr:hypothetical protein [Burkholderiaceae bacterium]
MLRSMQDLVNDAMEPVSRHNGTEHMGCCGYHDGRPGHWTAGVSQNSLR